MKLGILQQHLLANRRKVIKNGIRWMPLICQGLVKI